MRVMPDVPVSSNVSNVRYDWQNLLLDGPRSFFCAAVVHAAIGRLLWIGFAGLQLPLARSVPQAQWQLHELFFGTFAAALAGSVAMAGAEDAEAAPGRSRTLRFSLAAWLLGRLAGIAGTDASIPFLIGADLAFFSLLGWFVLRRTIAHRSAGHGFFLAVIALLAAAEVVIGVAWVAKNFGLSARLVQTALLILVIHFAFVNARIHVGMQNLARDSSEMPSPYRPHSGRQDMALVMTALYALVVLILPESRAPAFLAIAAGCAFMDRLAEWFVGPSRFKTPILALALANCLIGLGLIVIGFVGLGMGIFSLAGIHILAIGGIGLTVMAVICIPGFGQPGRPLALPWQGRAAILLVIVACFAGVLPRWDTVTGLARLHYWLATLCWAGAYAVWLSKYLPYFLKNPIPAGNGPERFGDSEQG